MVRAWSCLITTARTASPAREESEAGLRHLAFQVEDVAAHEKLLKAEGVEITLSTCDLPNLGARVLLFLDPNGVTLEFCEKFRLMLSGARHFGSKRLHLLSNTGIEHLFRQATKYQEVTE